MLILVLALIYNSYLYNKVIKDKDYQVKARNLTFQCSMDLLLFTFLLFLTGGSQNPFYALFYVMAVFGGILTAASGGLFYFSFLITCLLIIQIYPVLSVPFAAQILFNPQTVPYLLSQLTIPAIVFFMARSFGKFLLVSQKNLLGMTVHSERLDRLRAVGALSAGFSHEFASPLHAAKIRLKRLGRSLPQENEDLKECELALADCETVLKRMNSSQLQIEQSDFENIDLTEHVKQIAENWKRDFPGIEIQFQIEEAIIRAPRINLTQSLLNIFDNSSEAMSHKGKIDIAIRKISEQVELSVTDHGPGFNQEILRRFGEPFNTDKNTGTGLGLYSSNLFMHSVGGKIDIRNNPDGGSSILFIFPGSVK